MKEKNYFLGLDVGTNSIGWAVTDAEYNLQKVKGEDFWGSYLFEKAKSKKERRSFRSQRRRLARVHQRLMLLQSLFVDEINKIDPAFFIRLNDSALHFEDKSEGAKTTNVLFNDADYTDKDFYKKFKTIFHLRKDLIEGKKYDIRHLYLAVHHIIKNRGNFLFEGQNFNFESTDVIKSKFTAINVFFEDRDLDCFSMENIDDVLKVIIDFDKTKIDRQKEMKTLFNVDSKQKHLLAVIKLLTGGSGNLQDLYCLEEKSESFEFSSSFDENVLPKIAGVVGSDDLDLVYSIKAIYDWSVLHNILGEEKYISFAKVNSYENHKRDLELLKKYVKSLGRDAYRRMFYYSQSNTVSDEDNGDDEEKSKKPKALANYASYIGSDRGKSVEKVSKDDFYAFLKKAVKDCPEIMKRIKDGNFLQKQISGENGVIPYQVHLKELEVILKNAEKQFGFLSAKQDGLTVSEKIIKLMTFRIPYYVGPIGGKVEGAEFAWAKRKDGVEKVKVTPWNFESVIDSDASEEEFIKRMTLKCTYLKKYDVLPKHSLLYSEFAFLNQLNNLTVYGKKDERARRIILEFAKTKKKITLKECLKKLRENGFDIPEKEKAEHIFGGVDEFSTSLSSFALFNKILNGQAEQKAEMCENIIKLATLISDKERLIKRVKKEYPELTEQQLKDIKSCNFKDWGRLSREFLCEVKSPKFVRSETGELMSIIEIMRENPLNLTQIIETKGNGFNEVLQELNGDLDCAEKLTYETVDNLYCSPLVKRPIWRTVNIVREIVKVNKQPPKKIFIEMTRGDDDKNKGQRTISRKERLLSLYKQIKDESRDWISEISAREEREFLSDKIYFYYCQMGRCLYTNKEISIDQITDTQLYDIDHIYPQSKIKDDSLDNRVLVYKTYNQSVKKNIYPLPDELRNDQKIRALWKFLYEKELISKEKYYRLTRATPLSATELADFINRQLVVTNQSTKEIANILKRLYPKTEIVYSKARRVSEFRRKYGMTKVREVNDSHHAKDAYLNIVVGNCYNVKYGHDASMYFSKDFADPNEEEMFNRPIIGAWQPALLGKIKKVYAKQRVRTAYFVTEQNGRYYDLQPQTATKDNTKKALVPLKTNGPLSDVTKYGGYNKVKTAYFALVKSVGKKGKTRLSLEQIPVYVVNKNGDKSQNVIDYVTTNCGLIEPTILIDKIKINTLFEIDGSSVLISGKTGEQIIWENANQLYLDQKLIAYIKKIVSFNKKAEEYNNRYKKQKLTLQVNPEFDKISAVENLQVYDVLLQKLCEPVYKVLSISSQYAFLREKRQVFEKLLLEEQCKALVEILKLFQCNSVLSNFKIIEGKKTCGKILTSKFIEDRQVKIINQSPTCHYSAVICVNDLL